MQEYAIQIQLNAVHIRKAIRTLPAAPRNFSKCSKKREVTILVSLLVDMKSQSARIERNI